MMKRCVIEHFKGSQKYVISLGHKFVHFYKKVVFCKSWKKTLKYKSRKLQF